MNNTKDQNIGEMVASDYRLAEVFRNYKIDFCCKGNRTLQEVCENGKLPLEQISAEIQNLQSLTPDRVSEADFKSWPMDLLVDYIEKKHHRYVVSKTPVILGYLKKICDVHGENHPELYEVFEIFSASSKDLAAHMKKEELLLFPHIRKMMRSTEEDAPMASPHFGSVKNPIAMMMNEHETEGDRFLRIAELTNSYTPPVDACNTYKVTFALLEAFERDLHKHVHLENNVLFPQAVELEKSMIETPV